MDEGGLGRDRTFPYTPIGALILIIGGLSIFVIRDKQKNIDNSDQQENESGETESSKEPADEDEIIESVEAPNNEIPAEAEQVSSNNERWLRTDKQAIIEVDRLMDKFGELEKDEREIDDKISQTTNRINGKE